MTESFPEREREREREREVGSLTNDLPLIINHPNLVFMILRYFNNLVSFPKRKKRQAGKRSL